MPTYRIQAPNGRTYEIEGPPGATAEQVIAEVLRRHPDAGTPKQSGVLAQIKRGFEQLGSQSRTGIAGLLDPNKAAEEGLQRGEEIDSRYAEGPSLDAIAQKYQQEGVGPAAMQALRQAPEAIAGIIPSSAASLGAGIAGAKLGTMAGGPVGGAIGAALGAFGASALPQFGGNIERQAQEQQKQGVPIDVHTGKAGAAAAAQGALDAGSMAFTLGGQLISKLTNVPLKALAGDTSGRAAKIAEERLLTTLAKEGTLKAIAKGTAKGALLETPTEVIQLMLERAQAGLSLTDEEALKEYGETAYQAVHGAPLGAVGRVSERNAARAQVEKENVLKEAEARAQADKDEALRRESPEYKAEVEAAYLDLQKQVQALQQTAKTKVDADDLAGKQAQREAGKALGALYKTPAYAETVREYRRLFPKQPEATELPKAPKLTGQGVLEGVEAAQGAEAVDLADPKAATAHIDKLTKDLNKVVGESDDARVLRERLAAKLDATKQAAQAQQQEAAQRLQRQETQLQNAIEDLQTQGSDAAERGDAQTVSTLARQFRAANKELAAVTAKLDPLRKLLPPPPLSAEQATEIAAQIETLDAKLKAQAGNGFDPDKAVKIADKISALRKQLADAATPQQAEIQEDLFTAGPARARARAAQEQRAQEQRAQELRTRADFARYGEAESEEAAYLEEAQDRQQRLNDAAIGKFRSAVDKAGQTEQPLELTGDAVVDNSIRRLYAEKNVLPQERTSLRNMQTGLVGPKLRQMHWMRRLEQIEALLDGSGTQTETETEGEAAKPQARRVREDLFGPVSEEVIRQQQKGSPADEWYAHKLQTLQAKLNDETDVDRVRQLRADIASLKEEHRSAALLDRIDALLRTKNNLTPETVAWLQRVERSMPKRNIVDDAAALGGADLFDMVDSQLTLLENGQEGAVDPADLSGSINVRGRPVVGARSNTAPRAKKDVERTDKTVDNVETKRKQRVVYGPDTLHLPDSPTTLSLEREINSLLRSADQATDTGLTKSGKAAPETQREMFPEESVKASGIGFRSYLSSEKVAAIRAKHAALRKRTDELLPLVTQYSKKVDALQQDMRKQQARLAALRERMQRQAEAAFDHVKTTLQWPNYKKWPALYSTQITEEVQDSVENAIEKLKEAGQYQEQLDALQQTRADLLAEREVLLQTATTSNNAFVLNRTIVENYTAIERVDAAIEQLRAQKNVVDTTLERYDTFLRWAAADKKRVADLNALDVTDGKETVALWKKRIADLVQVQKILDAVAEKTAKRNRQAQSAVVGATKHAAAWRNKIRQILVEHLQAPEGARLQVRARTRAETEAVHAELQKLNAMAEKELGREAKPRRGRPTINTPAEDNLRSAEALRILITKKEKEAQALEKEIAARRADSEAKMTPYEVKMRKRFGRPFAYLGMAEDIKRMAELQQQLEALENELHWADATETAARGRVSVVGAKTDPNTGKMSTHSAAELDEIFEAIENAQIANNAKSKADKLRETLKEAKAKRQTAKQAAYTAFVQKQYDEAWQTYLDAREKLPKAIKGDVSQASRSSSAAPSKLRTGTEESKQNAGHSRRPVLEQRRQEQPTAQQAQQEGNKASATRTKARAAALAALEKRVEDASVAYNSFPVAQRKAEERAPEDAKNFPPKLLAVRNARFELAEARELLANTKALYAEPENAGDLPILESRLEDVTRQLEKATVEYYSLPIKTRQTVEAMPVGTGHQGHPENIASAILAKQAVDALQAEKAKLEREITRGSRAVQEQVSEEADAAIEEEKELRRKKGKKDIPILDVDDSLFSADAREQTTPLRNEAVQELEDKNLPAALHNVAQNSRSSFARAVAQRLKLLLGDVQVNLVDGLKHKDGSPANGAASSDGRAVWFDRALGLNEETLLHESAHAATEAVLRMPETALTPQQLAAKRELQRMFEFVRRNDDILNEPAKENLSEFIAEGLSDPTLQAQMRLEKWDLGSLWDSLKRGLLKLLGISKPENMLDSFAALTDTLFAAPARLRTTGKTELSFRKPRYADGLSGASAAADAVIAKERTTMDRIKDGGLGLSFIEAAMVDRWAPLAKVAAENMDKLNGLQMMYYARNYDQKMHFIAQAVSRGVPVRKEVKRADGRTEFLVESDDGPNLRNVVLLLRNAPGGSPEANSRLFSLYLVAKRAANKGLARLNYSGDITQDMLDTAMREINAIPGLAKAFGAAAQEYNEYNKGLLNFAVQSGAISRSVANKLLAEEDYVPFYRERNGALEMVLGNEGIVRIGSIKEQPYLQRLKGGETRVLDFMTSAVQNTNMLVDMSLRNMAAKSAAFELENIGLAKIRNGAKVSGPDVVHFKIDGEDRHAVIDTTSAGVDPLLLVKGMEGVPFQTSAWLRLMAFPAQVLRKAVTLSPVYAARQLFRDSASSFIGSGSNAIPVLGALRQIGKEHVLERRGVIGGQVFTGDNEDLTRLLRRMQADPNVFYQMVGKLESMSMGADAATRKAQYDSYKEQGLSEMEATYMALDVMNFSKHGFSATARTLNQLIPFFNAQVQSLNVLAKTFRGKMPFNEKLKIREKLLARGLSLAAMSFFYAMAMQDDDTYKNATPEEKYGNWFVPLPGMSESLRLPIPFELGYIFKALPEAMANMIYNEHGAEDAKKAAVFIAQQLIPGGSSYGVPQALRPAIEALLGTSFYTRRSIETPIEQDLAPAKRVRETTTEAAKVLGEAFNYSPVKIDQLIRGYTGGMGMAAVQLVSFAMPAAFVGPERAALRTSELPVVGGLFQPKDGRGMINAMYDRIQEAEQAKKTFEHLVKSGKQKEAEAFLKENLAAFEMSGLATSLKGTMQQIAHAEAAVRASTLSAEEKRARLDEYRQMKIQVAQVGRGLFDSTKRQ